MDDRAIAPSKNRVASSWAQSLCLQYSPLLTFEDVIEERRATRPRCNHWRRINTTDVVIEDRIVGQPFSVADPRETAGETMPGLLAVC
jgi:hypothetical protein